MGVEILKTFEDITTVSLDCFQRDRVFACKLETKINVRQEGMRLGGKKMDNLDKERAHNVMLIMRELYIPRGVCLKT